MSSRHSSSTAAVPVGAIPGRHFGAHTFRRPLAGIITTLILIGIVALAFAQFRGSFATKVPITVVTERAGLLMGVGAKVKLHGAQIGTVSAVDETPDGQARLTLAIEPSRLAIVPGNVLVDVGANTVFGAKSVEFRTPPAPSATPLQAGQVLDSEHVTVEVNTIFEDLNSVLSHIDPAKLNETLGAMSTAFGGRGEQFGQTLSDANAFLATIEPSLPTFGHEIQTMPDVMASYADAAPELVDIMKNASRISSTLVEKQSDLDRFLVSSIGLADTGNDVIGGNRESLSNLMHLLVPTTDLLNRYNEALNCTLAGITKFAFKAPSPVPGVYDLAGLILGIERYRYPQDLAKVAATGGPQCKGQLPLQAGYFPPKVVADIGTNTSRYGNDGILLNSDALKQLLFGPIDGPPRNTAQWGQPG